MGSETKICGMSLKTRTVRRSKKPSISLISALQVILQAAETFFVTMQGALLAILSELIWAWITTIKLLAGALARGELAI